MRLQDYGVKELTDYCKQCSDSVQVFSTFVKPRWHSNSLLDLVEEVFMVCHQLGTTFPAWVPQIEDRRSSVVVTSLRTVRGIWGENKNFLAWSKRWRGLFGCPSGAAKRLIGIWGDGEQRFVGTEFSNCFLVLSCGLRPFAHFVDHLFMESCSVRWVAHAQR